jgi:gliding motility-associated-like protein
LEKLKLTVLAKKENSKTATICSGSTYDFYGKKLTQSGDYEQLIKTAQGCDSLEKLKLTVLAKKENSKTATICSGSTYDFYGKKLTQSGDYQELIKTSQGCDSLEKLKLTVLAKKENSKTATICSGSMYDFYGKKLTQSGDYQELVKTAQGCDSLEKLKLTVLAKKENSKTATICSGTTYDFYGKKLTQSGDYQELVKTAQGCDSLEKLKLTVLAKKENSKTVTICSGATYDFYGKKLTQSGDYQELIKTAQGCDSLEKLKLTVLAKPILQVSQDVTVNEGTSVKLKATFQGDSLKSIAWLPSTFLDKDNALEVTAKPTEPIDYQVIAKDKNGCEAQGNVKISLFAKKKIFSPTSFSPNDDCFNDVFEIFVKPEDGNIENYEIFDRWGNKIYENSEPWNGKDFAVGVYTYRIDIRWKDGKSQSLSGDVMLVR